MKKRQILVTCKCGNKYHMYGDKPFKLDINGPIILTCSVCEKEWDLYKLGKKYLEDNPLTEGTAKSETV